LWVEPWREIQVRGANISGLYQVPAAGAYLPTSIDKRHQEILRDPAVLDAVTRLVAAEFR